MGGGPFGAGLRDAHRADNALGFGRVEGYDAPAWPNENGSKQFHFDLAVDDLDDAEKAAVELGATWPTRSPARPGGCCSTRRGHPFCLTKAENWG